ncbi:hypothetical protein BDV35DRAFT_356552 [Aspergillus flavus]|nr:hypothetical protein BDV35DRAFT_356552 [Aspergillus flavus]
MPRTIPGFFSHAPLCCESRMIRRRTEDNSKGNVNRWRYTCRECDRMVFDDWEGIRDGNPSCYCGEISRGQVEKGEAYVFRCARKQCWFKDVLEEDEL